MAEGLSQIIVNVDPYANLSQNPEPPPPPVQPKSGSVFFDDGIRRIDFVLVFEKDENTIESKDLDSISHIGVVSSNVLKRLEAIPRIGHDTTKSDEERERIKIFFESNLIAEGLELEEDIRKEDDGRLTIFVKVHAPWLVLCKQAELLRMKMPLKLRDTFKPPDDFSITDRLFNYVKSIVITWKKQFGLDDSNIESVFRARSQTATLRDRQSNLKEDEPKRVTWQFRRKKIERFDIVDENTFFSPIQRMEMVWEILQKARNEPDDEKRRGIEMLLHNGIYEAAFPLHDASDRSYENTAAPITEWPQRQILRHTWASWKALFKRQPLELIRSYYGEKIAFYFAFLGFYTKWLVFPAIFGMCAFLFGVWYPVDDEIIREICNKTAPPGIDYLCPICEPHDCEFTKYNEHCTKAKMANWMDNEATILVAFVTIAWATVFRKAWKRREAELAFEWDVYELGEQEDIVIRPEYEHRALTTRPNPVTRQTEPYIPPIQRLRWKAASTSVTLLMLLAVACALVALVIARIKLYKSLKDIGVHENVEASRYIVHGLIFIVVLIFDSVYNMIAEKVTSLECPRTQDEWLSSFLWKVFIFELLNDFVPIAYAAWVKGRTVKTPLELDWKSELCDPNGCMAEVTELIAVLLLARMFVGNAVEIGLPFLKHYLNKFVCDTASTTGEVSKKPQNTRARGHHGKTNRQSHRKRMDGRKTTTVRPIAIKDGKVQNVIRQPIEIEEKRWRSDVLLGELELDGVASEYMEMIVQFAFCTLFVPALPVAATVSLLNNIMEIRVDAIKILASHRRPLPARVSGIGIWNNFLAVIVKLSVLCNAGLIAFTSDAIVRVFYNFADTTGYSYAGFPEWSLSQIPASDLRQRWPHVEEELEKFNIHQCYYSGYRNSFQPYEVNEKWWQVWTIRMGAFGIVVAIGFTFQFVYDSLVPDVPEHIRIKIQRQRYVLSRAMESEAAYETWLRNHNYQKKDEKSVEPRVSTVTKRDINAAVRQSNEQRQSRTSSRPSRTKAAWTKN